MRTFETGATRDTDQGKPDYEGFLSPFVLERFGQYMSKHRIQADGSVRDSDNWQKGIPQSAYIKSLFRHFMELWKAWRTTGAVDEEAACAMFFNIQGLLHEHLKPKAEEITHGEKIGGFMWGYRQGVGRNTTATPLDKTLHR